MYDTENITEERNKIQYTSKQKKFKAKKERKANKGRSGRVNEEKRSREVF